MDQNQNTSLFGLGIEPATKAHLSEAARWAKFLAIVGFVLIGLLVVVAIFFGSVFSFVSSRSGGSDFQRAGYEGIVGGFVMFMYIIVAAIYFFPCLFLFRFSVKMKTALAANDQETLNTSFQNLKKMFRFVGILTIIGLALFALQFFFLLVGIGVASM
jgi:uncharacterized membrane protein